MTAVLSSSEFTALGTTALVGVTDPAALEPARALLEEELAAIDLACSRFRPDSELSRVNRAGGRPVAVGPLFVTALKVALRAAELTDGDVDPTLGRQLCLAGYDRDFARVEPDGPELPKRPGFPAAGRRAVDLDAAAGTVRLPAGVELDLGATAKALAADRAARRAHEETGTGVLVSLGGDIAVAGAGPPGGWSVGVADDHADRDAGETVAIASGGLATSSTRVRRWRRGGRELHHVIDPRSGRPTGSCWRTVSVAAGSCVDANTASTAALVRADRAPDWLAELGLPARLVRQDGRIVRVGGWPPPASASEEA